MAKDELPDIPDTDPDDANKPAWWNPKRVYEFGKNIVSLETSVSTLKEENRQLRVQVRNLQSQVNHLGGQMQVLTGFVESAVETRIDARVDLKTREFIDAMAQSKNKD